MDLPPNLSAIVIDGVEVQGSPFELEARMLQLEPEKRDAVVVVLSNGFRAPWGKFTSGDDEP
jgi:hypothetical protein